MTMPADIAFRVQQILAARGFTLHRVSVQSAEIFGRSSPFYIPHSLYSRLSPVRPAPSIEQFLALSHITNYRFPDLLAVFGLDLDLISAIRLQIPRKATTLLDSEVYDAHAWIPWFAARSAEAKLPSIAPLGQFLAPASPKRAWQIMQRNTARFLYAQVGSQDLYALPYFAPGSVVRADSRLPEGQSFRQETGSDSRFFLVEHDSGWTCSQILWPVSGKAVLYSAPHPFIRRELRLGSDAQILGVIDAELRPLSDPSRAAAAAILPSPPRSRSNRRRGGPARAGELFRQARLSAGLSFREASSLSRTLAAELSDGAFFLATGTLSDYETMSQPPRQIQKILALCVLYGIPFEECFRVFRLPLDRAGCEPIPDDLMPRTLPAGTRREPTRERTAPNGGGLLDLLVEQWEDVPLFLRHSLQHLSGFRGFSLSDVFWVGGEKQPLHPLLANATLIAVNRRARKPPPSLPYQVCEPPLFLILDRNGNYRCGPSTLERDLLTLRAYLGNAGETQEFREGIDAEAVGRVTAILRKLPS